MIKNYFIVLFFILFIVESYAQSGFIAGKVTDYEDEGSLVGANLIISKSSDSTVTYYTVSDENGNFKFAGLEAGEYRLEISYIGYQTLVQLVSLAGEPKDLGILTLKKDTTQLKEVVIEEKVVPVRMQGDTTQFDAKAYKTNPMPTPKI